MLVDNKAQGDLARPFVGGGRQGTFNWTPSAGSARAGKGDLLETEWLLRTRRHTYPRDCFNQGTLANGLRTDDGNLWQVKMEVDTDMCI
jgi:hypothetical protein